MRYLLAILLALAAIGEAQAQSDFKVTLLGTASPSPRPNRFGPSTLVEAGDQKLLFDAGRGVPIRMWQIKVPMGKLDALFDAPLWSNAHWGVAIMDLDSSTALYEREAQKGFMPASNMKPKV